MRSNDPRGAFAKDMDRNVKLTEEEKRSFVATIQNPTSTHEEVQGAGETLVLGHLAFIHARTGRYGKLVARDVLTSHGCDGLLDAAQRFNLEAKNQFLTYAVWWIEKYIKKAIAQEKNVIALPIYKPREDKRTLHRNTSLSPSRHKKQRRLQSRRVAEAVVKKNLARELLSFERPLHSRKDGRCKTFTLEKSLAIHSPSAEEQLIERELAQEISIALGRLDTREREVLLRRLNGETLKEIAVVFSLSRESIRNIESKTLKCLCRVLRFRKLAGVS